MNNARKLLKEKYLCSLPPLSEALFQNQFSSLESYRLIYFYKLLCLHNLQSKKKYTKAAEIMVVIIESSLRSS